MLPGVIESPTMSSIYDYAFGKVTENIQEGE
jgi:hypothetical protein